MKIKLTHEVEIKVAPNGLLIGGTLVTYSLLLDNPDVLAALESRLDSQKTQHSCCGSSAGGCGGNPSVKGGPLVPIENHIPEVYSTCP